MKRIPLTQGMYTVVDDEDYALVSQHKWHAVRCREKFYARRRVGCKKIGLHQFLLPGVSQIDHRDGDSLNNTRRNLRPATFAENQRNKRRMRHNTSGFKGVSWHRARRKWQSRIRLGESQKTLGYFDDPVLAAKVYDEAAQKLHGDFASLNFS